MCGGRSTQVRYGLKRFLGVVALAAVATLAVTVGHRAVRAHAQAVPGVTVSPASGSQDDTFVFDGVGFAPGETLTETYTDPSGQQYAFFASDGTPLVIQAGSDGSWEVSVHPATDFAGAYAGTWMVDFCSQSSGTCFSGTIDISL